MTTSPYGSLILLLQVIYGKSSGTSHRPTARTPVTYHKKVPTFSEEIKVRLPPVLSTQHHILFTFYHINCQPKGKNSEVENVIGYAAIPFFMDNKYVFFPNYIFLLYSDVLCIGYSKILCTLFL